MTINAIAKIYQIDRDTVSTWIRKWEHDGPERLHDKPRSGPSTHRGRPGDVHTAS